MPAFLLSRSDYAREVGKEVNNGFLFDNDYFTAGGVLQVAGCTPDAPPVRMRTTSSARFPNLPVPRREEPSLPVAASKSVSS